MQMMDIMARVWTIWIETDFSTSQIPGWWYSILDFQGLVETPVDYDCDDGSCRWWLDVWLDAVEEMTVFNLTVVGAG